MGLKTKGVGVLIAAGMGIVPLTGLAMADNGNPGRFEVCSSAWVRDAPSNYATVIGTLTRPETFDVTADSENGYDYGYAYGHVDRWGYIPDRDLC